MSAKDTLKPARQIATLEVQPKTPSGKPAGMPLSVDVEPKEKTKAKRRRKNHYVTLMRMDCRVRGSVIKNQYCPETKKFSANFYQKFGDRELSDYAIYDDGDRWNLWVLLLSMYPHSIRKDIMTFMSYFKPLQSESKHIANRLEEARLQIHEAEKAHYRRARKKSRRFKDYGPPPRKVAPSSLIKNKKWR
jgi:hypothetical protein